MALNLNFGEGGVPECSDNIPGNATQDQDQFGHLGSLDSPFRLRTK